MNEGRKFKEPGIAGSTAFGSNEALAGWMQQIVPFGIFTTDRDLRIQTWNEWLVTHSGLAASDAVGRLLTDIFPDLEERRLRERYVRALQGEVSILSTALHKYLLPFPATVAGSGLPHMLQTARIAPLPENASIAGTITVIEDVSQREYHAGILARQQELDRLLSGALATLLQAEDPVREMEGIFATLRVALGLDLHASYLAGAGGRKLQLNSAAGLSPKQRESITTLAVSETDERLLRDSAARTAVIDSASLQPLKSVGVAAQCSFALAVGDRVLGLVTFGTYQRPAIAPADISVLGRVARYLAIAIDRAIREADAMAASRAKDDFLAALSHELRTPLNPVLLLASDGGQNPNFPEEARDAFRMIERNAHLEARLIDDLLDLTRIAHGKLGLDPKAMDLNACLRETLALVRPEIVERGQTLFENFDIQSRIIVGDSDRLQQVFWNVLKNAAKFTPHGGTISVTTSEDLAKGELLVTVTDSGVGMLPHELDRIFEAFAQGDHASTQGQSHRFGGLGLGLSITRKLVELHGGSISATSAGKDLGTTIVIRLPLSADAKPSGVTKTSPSPESPVARLPKGSSEIRRILLVEDHEATRIALKRLLERRGFQVTSVPSATAALEAATAVSFHLVLSDIGLPDETGYSLMRKLRATHNLKGIALTGYGMDEDVARGHEAGFSAHLTKPVSVQALDRALTEIFAE